MNNKLNQEIVNLVQKNCDILKSIEKLKPTGFGFGGLQQSVSDKILSPAELKKSVLEICDDLSIQHKASTNEVLRNMRLCFDNNKYSQITLDTFVQLDDINLARIEQSIKTLQAIMPRIFDIV